MSEQLKFHVSTIVSMLTGVMVINDDTLPPPITLDDKPADTYKTNMDCLIGLAKYVTQSEVAKRVNPETGKSQFDVAGFLKLAPITQEALRKQFPKLAEIEVPKFADIADEVERQRQVSDWIESLEAQYGAYHAVQPIVEEKTTWQTKARRTNGDSMSPFSAN